LLQTWDNDNDDIKNFNSRQVFLNCEITRDFDIKLRRIHWMLSSYVHATADARDARSQLQSAGSSFLITPRVPRKSASVADRTSSREQGRVWLGRS